MPESVTSFFTEPADFAADLAKEGSGSLVITYFNARKDYIDRLLPVGQRRIVSGTMALYDGMLQMVHPDFVVDEAALATLPAIQPIYPLTEGLTPQALRRAVAAALEQVPPLAEWLDASLLGREKWPGFGDALRTLHRPAEPPISPGGPAGRGSPMTRCWRACSRSPWCAPICGGTAAAHAPMTGACRPRCWRRCRSN